MDKETRANLFLQKARTKFTDKFSYEQVEYINSKTKVTIICPIHGEFNQTPEKHISSIHGCPKCADASTSNKNTSSTEEFIAKAVALHGTKYTYSSVDYKSYTTPINIICNTCGNTFSQTPNAHMNGSGCSSCSSSGFREDLPGIFYYLKINDGQAYKIGITNRTVTERFNLTDLQKIEVIGVKEFTNGKTCKDVERNFLTKYAAYRWKGPNLLASGNTELFFTDILKDEKVFNE